MNIDGSEVPVTELETLDYARIVKKDQQEINKLLKAASMPGFFHLDLRDEPTGEFLPSLQSIYRISEGYFKSGEKQEMFEVSFLSFSFLIHAHIL